LVLTTILKQFNTAWYAGHTGITSSHSHRLIIPDDVLIQFDLLMMSTVMFETCREMR